MNGAQIAILIVVAAIAVPIWLYIVAYMTETARLNAHRDWRRQNGRQSGE